MIVLLGCSTPKMGYSPWNVVSISSTSWDIGTSGLQAAILNFWTPLMSSIMDDSTNELLYPENGGNRWNFVSICYRSRDNPGEYFYPLLTKYVCKNRITIWGLINFFWLQIICTEKVWITTLSAKKLQLLGDLVPQTPYYFLCVSKIKQFPEIKYSISICSWMWGCEQLDMFSNHAWCCLIQMFASNMHQNEWFQVRFFKNFLGRGSPSPSPDPSARFRSGLRPRARASPSILGRFAPSIVKLSPTTISQLPPPMLERNLCISRNFFSPLLETNCPPMHNFLATGL